MEKKIWQEPVLKELGTLAEITSNHKGYPHGLGNHYGWEKRYDDKEFPTTS